MDLHLFQVLHLLDPIQLFKTRWTWLSMINKNPTLPNKFIIKKDCQTRFPLKNGLLCGSWEKFPFLFYFSVVSSVSETTLMFNWGVGIQSIQFCSSTLHTKLARNVSLCSPCRTYLCNIPNAIVMFQRMNTRVLSMVAIRCLTKRAPVKMETRIEANVGSFYEREIDTVMPTKKRMMMMKRSPVASVYCWVSPRFTFMNG